MAKRKEEFMTWIVASVHAKGMTEVVMVLHHRRCVRVDSITWR